MSTESIIVIVTVIAAFLIAFVGMSTLFYKTLSDVKKDLQRDMRDMKSDLQHEMGEMKEGLQREMGDMKREMGDMKQTMQHETSRIWKSIDAMRVEHQTLSDRVDKLSDRVSTLSDRVNQVIVGTGVDVKESGVSYKGGEGATPAAKLKGGSKKSG